MAKTILDLIAEVDFTPPVINEKKFKTNAGNVLILREPVAYDYWRIDRETKLARESKTRSSYDQYLIMACYLATSFDGRPATNLDIMGLDAATFKEVIDYCISLSTLVMPTITDEMKEMLALVGDQDETP